MYRLVVLIFALVYELAAQEGAHDHMQMQMADPAAQVLMGQASGTSLNPRSWAAPMVMLMPGSWTLMWMAQAFVADTQQTGPRGADKFFSVNYGMFAATHKLGKGSFEFETMLSLEPATVTNRRYPELFQTGETAYGRPLVDAQHPHDLIMALGVHYAYPINEHTLIQIYFAPVGDPALGPVAFPHRASAAEIPQAPLSHHWQDSTHIANEVVTATVDYRKVRLEASGFYGTEPNENRWNIDHGPINSWSTRFFWLPTSNWLAQVSVGRLAHPERQETGDVVRSTASVQYSRPMKGSSWSSSLVWGRNHKTTGTPDTDSYLFESVLPVTAKNILTGRAEWVEKDELFADMPGLNAGRAFRIGAYTAGYTREIGAIGDLQVGLGANLTAYTVPQSIRAYYGDHPMGAVVFIRLRLQPVK